MTFEIVKNALISVTEEMGVVLRRSSFSANIKERKDFSCALFDPRGRLVSQAEHIPVHLGAMPYSVSTVLQDCRDKMTEGDSFILNDPFRGGTHLPDITMVSPIFNRGELLGFAANRAHHSDVGGSAPGSMSSLSMDIYQEGMRIPPVKLTVRGKLQDEILHLILSNVRTPKERLGDLRAQQAANTVGTKRFLELTSRFSRKTVLSAMGQLLDYSRNLMVREMRNLPKGSVSAVDYMDDDGFETMNIPIRLKLTVDQNNITFDFTGSSPQVRGPINAVYSITLSAVYYVVRCVTDPKIPPNAGCFQPVRVVAPEGTIVNAKPPAAVAGGNVETSQRIVDVCFRAFGEVVPKRVCAACQGTMNNLTIGGVDPHTGHYFTYYETIAGGYGARYGKDGIDGVHSHMTNTLNTPVEALESAFPLRIKRYGLRPESGGKGAFKGGLGIRRDIEILSPEATVSLLGERHRVRPWGFRGGGPGSPGEYHLLRNGSGHEKLPSKCVIKTKPSDVVSLKTPGGGGYGSPKSRASLATSGREV